MKIFVQFYFRSAFLFALIILTKFALAQADPISPVEQLKSFTESIYGLDDVLVNGKIYRQLYESTNSHPYYGESNWQVGEIFVNGQRFKNVLLKYDLALDRVVIRKINSSGIFTHILLSDKLVDAFTIDNQHFVKASGFTNNNNLGTYVKLVHKEEPYFFIKHKKTYSPSGNKGFYFKKPLYYFSIKGELKRVSNRKAFINLFSPHEKEIRQYLNTHKIDFLNATQSELEMLVKFSKKFLEEANE